MATINRAQVLNTIFILISVGLNVVLTQRTSTASSSPSPSASSSSVQPSPKARESSSSLRPSPSPGMSSSIVVPLPIPDVPSSSTTSSVLELIPQTSSVTPSQSPSSPSPYNASLTEPPTVSENSSEKSSVKPITSTPLTPTAAPAENDSTLYGANMYPYGPQQSDTEFNVEDTLYYWQCPEVKTDQTGFPFFGKRHYKLYLCSNGKIQLNDGWSWWWPRKFGVHRWFRNMAIIAPFWATTDEYVAFKAGHSKMYYHVYRQTKRKNNKTSDIMTMASENVRLYAKSEKFESFKATWVLVVTWVKLCPYVYNPWYYFNKGKISELNRKWSNTFQAVIITDGSNSFLMYNYPKGGIQWVVPVLPSYYRYWTSVYGLPVAGWNAGDSGRKYLNMKGSRTVLGMYRLDDKLGNTGELGRHFWRIENSDAKDARGKCLSWASLQEEMDFLYWHSVEVREDVRMACPCSLWQAWFDRRFVWDWRSSWPKLCFRSRRSKPLKYDIPEKRLVNFKTTQLCCYSTQWPGDWGALKTGPPDGSRVKVESFHNLPNDVEGLFTDLEAYKYCCVDTTLCRLFYQYRPSDDCRRYERPIIRWFCCDPHFKTLDGKNYTFNGLGEYMMIDAKNGTFQLQARTSPAQGNSQTATIFTAGVAKEENTSTVEVRVKTGGGIAILIDQKDYNGYNNMTNRSVEIDGKISVSKPKENCLEVSFPSTTSVQFCEKKEMLSFVVTPGDDYKNKTKGLLGTWNDNPDDDFTLPDGTVLPPPLTSREIHYQFGVKWQINQSQSLFTYAQNESVDTFANPDFVPMFADNITWYNDSVRQKAEDQCGDDYECLFDVASTNDVSVGMVTKDINIQLVNESNSLDNFPPKIVNASSEINATLHETVQLNITAEDNDKIVFHVTNKPDGATVNQSGNVLYFTWLVTSKRKFNLSFVATDDKGASTSWSPTINMCACVHDGQCVQPEEGDPVNTDSKFVYMGCACQGGYTGRFCDSDIDACEINGQPCYGDVKCIDLPPPANASGYKCGPCPSGYAGNGAQCAEIDECQTDNTNNCEQICFNVPGSFLCACRNGYRLAADGHRCEDVNECFPTNDCMQRCVNTLGSYNCSCDQYFERDLSDWRKCKATNPCSSGHGCQHICFKGSNNQAKCVCFANYELQSDGKTCKDINECDPANPLHRCNQICENTLGSYKCSCQKGFELSKNGYDCEDVNECMDDELYHCTDEFHKCVNTLGSYKCECDQGLFFIDGKCRDLEKNETAPEPVLPTPRTPTTQEREQAVLISIETKNNFKWDFQIDKSFKEKLATIISNYCKKNRKECSLKDSRDVLAIALYTADQVHLLPGYPRNAPDSLLVAFYVQQPLGQFIGNVSVLPGVTLHDIVLNNTAQLEPAVGGKILRVEILFKPTTSPTEKPVEEESSFDMWKRIAIGVSSGVFVIILVIVISFLCARKKGKSSVSPTLTDCPGEPVMMESYNRKTQDKSVPETSSLNS